MGTVFYWVLNMSITGSVTGLVILLLRFFKKIPRRVIYILWFIPLIRLWILFGFEIKYSLMSLISKYTTKTVVAP